MKDTLKNKNYFSYHNHTHFSNTNGFMDSCIKPEDYIKKAKEYGMKAIAFTEHGNVYSWIDKKRLANDNGLKYVHGIECYVTYDKNKKLRDNYHVVLLARNHEGVKEINKLSTKSFNRDDGSFYYNPRIELEDLINTSNNVIVTTACIGGILSSHNPDVMKKFIEFACKNRDRVFIELQCNTFTMQKTHNIKGLKIAEKYNLNIVAGVDSHYIDDETKESRKVLQRSKRHFKDESDFKDCLQEENYESKAFDMKFKNREELEEGFRKQGILTEEQIQTAIDNTNLIEEMIEDFELDRNFKYPKLFKNSEEELKKRTLRAIKDKGIKLDKSIKKRVNREYKDYKDTGTIDYLLLESEVKNFCKENDVAIGFGRGSVTGSYIAYLLDIHKVNPLKHGLNFERFINRERVSLADVDTDYTEEGRTKVKEYLYSKKELYCSSIITFNTIAMKGAIRDVGRALRIPLQIVDEIAKNIEDKEDDYREKFKKLFKYVDILLGTIVSVGIHPAGTIVSPVPLDKELGLCTVKDAEEPVSQLHMKEIDYLNFVKLDILGLKTLNVIEKACEYAGIEMITPEFLDKVAYNDEKVWKSIGEESLLVFQMDSDVGRVYCKEIFSEEIIDKIRGENNDFRYIDLLAIMNGAIRPSGDSYRAELLRGERHIYGFKPFDDFFKDTLGYCVFQEDIMKFLNKFCNMTMGQADMVRRGLAKKVGTEQYIPQIEKGFIDFAKEHYDMSEEEAKDKIKDILQVILDASNYAFSLNHSMPYSYIGYACAWLRYYYPLEYITAHLNTYMKDENNFNKAIKYMKRHTDITVKKPKFGESEYFYTFNKKENAIYEGIGKYKRMNLKAGEIVKRLGKKEYDSFIDLLKELKKEGMESRQIRILIIEDFFEMFGKNDRLYRIWELWNEIGNAKQMRVDKVDKLGLDHKIFEKYSNPEPKKTYMKIDIDNILKEHINKIENKEMTLFDRIELEKELMNEVIIVLPKLKKEYFLVENLVIVKGLMLVDLYNFKNGERESLWINDMETIQRFRLKKDDVIEVLDRTQRGLKKWRNLTEQNRRKRR